MIDPERLHAADVAILVLHHRAVRERVGVVAAWLRHISGSDDVKGLGNIYRPDECCAAWIVVVWMEFVD